MREQLGILLMEDQGEEISVQLFSDVKNLETLFKNMTGSPSDPSRRATIILMQYDTTGKLQVTATVKTLPIIELAENQPDGYVLGKGPVHFKKPD